MTIKTMTETEVKNLTLALMEEHGLNWPTWGFRLTRHKLVLGRCMYNRYGGGTIEISKNFLHLPFEKIRDTILHEIAHALAGHLAGHGPEWKRVCRRIGALPNEKADLLSEERVTFKWTGVCPNNPNHMMKRHALTSKGKRYACAKCCREHNGGVFTSRFLFEWHLTEDLEAAGRSGKRLITQPEIVPVRPTRISELIDMGL